MNQFIALMAFISFIANTALFILNDFSGNEWQIAVWSLIAGVELLKNK